MNEKEMLAWATGVELISEGPKKGIRKMYPLELTISNTGAGLDEAKIIKEWEKILNSHRVQMQKEINAKSDGVKVYVKAGK